jgi:hypothetical protein
VVNPHLGYLSWVTAYLWFRCWTNYVTHGELDRRICTRDRCAGATEDMQEAFPELKRVRGYAVVQVPGKKWPYRIEHWWMVTPDGTVIDPTVCQFEGLTPTYEPLDEKLDWPTGKCMECGSFTYHGESFCTDECEESFCRGEGFPLQPRKAPRKPINNPNPPMW